MEAKTFQDIEAMQKPEETAQLNAVITAKVCKIAELERAIAYEKAELKALIDLRVPTVGERRRKVNIGGLDLAIDPLDQIRADIRRAQETAEPEDELTA